MSHWSQLQQMLRTQTLQMMTNGMRVRGSAMESTMVVLSMEEHHSTQIVSKVVKS